MPTDEEIDGLVNNTAQFFDEIFNAEYPFEFENFQFQRKLHVDFEVNVSEIRICNIFSFLIYFCFE